MDLILGHISPEPISCPELKNISLALWVIQKTSFWFGRHVIKECPGKKVQKVKVALNDPLNSFSPIDQVDSKI